MSDIKKAKELRGMSDAELNERIDELAAEGMKLRFQQATMQLTTTARPTQVRREIARIKTILAARAVQGA
ncbi:MAG: 50S ribosomal protein L29 [Zetaproteobacteria bacterium CG12_big_fil_rev_8_21_14_0_65_55_1124]|nr:MAG: 50S ribosomal protein L29 [Zetaproteobacteria bacterium CG1_02_55_237]PIS18378.1 MAG: 50S ribosomal protein L29 [Zetaproteobacteria bacterium CG08_land_8_20_14_0_20_55_17]PIW43340.1 MAG: 50S ribosomal protein L29 [Zetaproteobacteria bacterium CG12_big_fil_rev_8_21_14_0_65_55_1124]PIY52194.1 MAG: 50S ribosomal protein L29 [Zetaproteobacteria bacterium CG_4_10_14_0_8_um_filter_55_43]PIZ37744.1 MAG: 50S ribosomal protein L29 [Zetaproteobacteria bacterium CG_4_10_14_0_2_um_filter_55_20]PJB